MQTFMCKSASCGKKSNLKRIVQSDDPPYVECEHCGAKNEIKALPTPDGAPMEFEVIGILKVST